MAMVSSSSSSQGATGVRRSSGQEVLVGIAGGPGVVHADHRHGAQVEGLEQTGELLVDEHEPRPRVGQDVADLVRAEPDVDGDQDAAAGGHAEVGLEHGRDVRAEEGHAVVPLHAGSAQGRGQPVHALLELPVRVAPRPVHHGHLVREDGGAPGEEAHRRELRAVGLAMDHRAPPGRGILAPKCTGIPTGRSRARCGRHARLGSPRLAVRVRAPPAVPSARRAPGR